MTELVWLAALGVLVGVLSAGLRPVPIAAAAAGAVLVGWLLGGWGFWGNAVAALAAAGAALLSARWRAAGSRAGTAASP